MEQLLSKLEMLHEPVRASHSLTIRSDREKQALALVLNDYRKLSDRARDSQQSVELIS